MAINPAHALSANCVYAASSESLKVDYLIDEANGVSASGFSADGTGFTSAAQIDLGSPSSVNDLAPKSIYLRVKVAAGVGTGDPIISKGSNPTANGGWAVNIGSSTDRSIRYQADGSGGDPVVFSGNNVYTEGGGYVDIIMRWDGVGGGAGNLNLDVDGVTFSGSTAGSTKSDATQTLRINNSLGSFTYEHIAIFDKELTYAEGEALRADPSSLIIPNNPHALIFDGVDDYATLATPFSIASGDDFSIKWRWPADSNSANHRIIGNSSYGSALDRIICFPNSNINIYDDAGGNVSFAASVDNTIDREIEIERISGQMRLYFDGVQQDITKSSTQSFSSIGIIGGNFSTPTVKSSLFSLSVSINGAPTYSYSPTDSSHAAGTPVLIDTVSGNHATGVNMPTDGSAWENLGGGPTSVEQSVQIDWNTIAQVNGSYELRWNLLNAVAGATQIDWNVLQEALNNAEFQWSLLETVDGTTQLDWRVLGSLVDASNSLQLDWSLLEAVDKNVQLDWSLLAQAQSGVDLRFNVLEQVAKSLQATWHVAASIESSTQLVWNLAENGSVSNSLELGWNVLAQISNQLAVEWTVLEQVGIDAELRWQIAAEIKNAVQVNWDLLNATSGEVQIVWHDIARVGGEVSLNWSIQSQTVILPVHQMIILPENRIMTVAQEARVMKII